MLNKKNQDNKIDDLLKVAEQGIKDVFNSERYKAYLETMSKFHSYSPRNIMLIMSQKPDASRVAGYATWKEKFERQVSKGEKGIRIIGFSSKNISTERPKINPETRTEILDKNGKPITEKNILQIPCFFPVYVYDVSQTTGKPLPQLTQELIGTVSEYNNIMQILNKISPYSIEFEEMEGSKKGYCHFGDKRIALKEGMSEAQTLKTAVHEIAHACCHTFEGERRTQEIEAESIAFVICNRFGIDTSDYSFNYIASWSSTRELKELTASLDNIQKQADMIIGKIENELSEYQLQNEKAIKLKPKELPTKISEKINSRLEQIRQLPTSINFQNQQQDQKLTIDLKER
ncbi:MAG: ImmA/IrrE family metallo-endopeptidase [Defluviitaleaceae bacterium]|nr:ImmA/IrrE family metallo-endopeptidase [Defluviitaleaceae bacterium]